MTPKRIAVIGAGPVGIEVALYAARLGHDVRVHERGRLGENMLRWGHVRLFSPWKLNHSPLGARLLGEAGAALPGPDDYLTGAEHVATYLEPLARSAPLAGRLHEGSTVLAVGRERIGKLTPLGGPRAGFPFRLLIEGPQGERHETADVVVDCSGTYGHHNWMGSGNVPALGERGLRDRIAYTLEDVAGTVRDRYAGRRVLLVGAGQSAATALDALLELDGTSVVWVSRRDRDRPLPEVPDDPLPDRARLARLANELAGGSDPRVDFRKASAVERVAQRGEGFEITLRSGASLERVAADRILAHVGYSPDNSIYRELQVHECYASFGPMQLAATLRADEGGDCLAQTSPGPEVLRNPEPEFYILGAKSYGKNSSFLIRLGLEQVREVFTLIDGRPEPNLYAA